MSHDPETGCAILMLAAAMVFVVAAVMLAGWIGGMIFG